MPADSQPSVSTVAAATATTTAGIESTGSAAEAGGGRGRDKASRRGEDGAISDKEATVRQLAEARMNRVLSLPECGCMCEPRTVSYAEVGDPQGFVAFFFLGVDSHRYMSLLLDKPARARGIRLICLDRPGRGRTSDFEDDEASRILQFPEILRHFIKVARIKHFSLVGQSLGASYALRCAQELPGYVATTVYLISPWVPLSVPGSSRALAAVEKLPAWVIKTAMSLGTNMPRLLAAAGGLSFMAKGCSEEEGMMFASDTTAEVLKAVGNADEQSQGVVLDALTALEKTQPFGFDYRDVSMPVHVFHGRADHMVPFAAVQWMSDEMPACTVSVKMGGTHALLMDSSVLGCVLECMCEDYKHFREHVSRRPSRSRSRTTGVPVPTPSFPAHTQHFQAKGLLRCREGMLIKGWEERYFILDGYELHQFDGPDSATARRVVDLRGTVAKALPDEGDRSAHDRTAGTRRRVFPFKLFDARHRVLHELAASSTGDRAFWVETLTKASRFTTGSGDGRRQAALNKGLLVTTRGANSRRVPGEGPGGARAGAELAAEGAGRREGGRSQRRQTLAPSSLRATGERKPSSRRSQPPTRRSLLSPDEDTTIRREMATPQRGKSVSRAVTPGNDFTRRKSTRALLHGTPFRGRTMEDSTRARSSIGEVNLRRVSLEDME
ncbi:unnamed protein product [Scytosiphon promiscuus]